MRSEASGQHIGRRCDWWIISWAGSTAIRFQLFVHLKQRRAQIQSVQASRLLLVPDLILRSSFSDRLPNHQLQQDHGGVIYQTHALCLLVYSWKQGLWPLTFQSGLPILDLSNSKAAGASVLPCFGCPGTSLHVFWTVAHDCTLTGMRPQCPSSKLTAKRTHQISTELIIASRGSITNTARSETFRPRDVTGLPYRAISSLLRPTETDIATSSSLRLFVTGNRS